ncbi:hypothetical protein LIER_36142 [Lithospermum erythrorhizon]|uniref:Uncharacterized protein n=1 Tax=Lithospermum erythrorhizon TaxID=34254 RepID=A0AAV3P247_LITER
METDCIFCWTKNRGVTASARVKTHTYIRKRMNQKDASTYVANACNPTTNIVDTSTSSNHPPEAFEQEPLVENISTNKDTLGPNTCDYGTTDSDVDGLPDEVKRSKCGYVEPPSGLNLTRGVDGGPYDLELIRSVGGRVGYYIWRRPVHFHLTFNIHLSYPLYYSNTQIIPYCILNVASSNVIRAPNI